MKKSYYAVKWGDTIRISGKVYTGKEACLECYGMVANNMEVKNLGTQKSVIQSDKQRRELLTSATGWIRSKRTLITLAFCLLLANCGQEQNIPLVISPPAAQPTATVNATGTGYYAPTGYSLPPGRTPCPEAGYNACVEYP